MENEPPTTEARATATPARPVDPGERILLLDVLRGFALGGVFVSNYNLWFSGRVFLPLERIKQFLARPLDAFAGHTFSALGFGKFMTIFSCLFGLGFAVQRMRAEDRGASVVPVYARRLLVLLGIGLAHMFGLWFGDILAMYAVTGFALFLFRRRSDRALLIWGFTLALAVPLAFHAGERFLPLLFGSREAAEAAQSTQTAAWEANRAAMLAGIESDSYFTMIKANAAFAVHDFLGLKTLPLLAMILGKFLLGFYAGRRGIFHKVDEHRKTLRRMLVIGLIAGALASGAGRAVRVLTMSAKISPNAWWSFAMPTVNEISMLGLAAFYAATIALLFQRPMAKRALGLLAPAGRMALTNYLTQSVIGMVTFYGIGLGFVGQWGPARCITVAGGLFVAQIALSHAWLARFRFGPAEWAWRSLTYGKAQPMRRAKELTPAAPEGRVEEGSSRGAAEATSDPASTLPAISSERS